MQIIEQKTNLIDKQTTDEILYCIDWALGILTKALQVCITHKQRAKEIEVRNLIQRYARHKRKIEAIKDLERR